MAQAETITPFRRTLAHTGGEPVYLFDLVEDRREIGGVAAVSRRLRGALAARLGPRLVPVRSIAAALGCGDPAEDYLGRERRAILALAERDPHATFLIPNFQSPIPRQVGRVRPRIVNIVHDMQFAHLSDLFTDAQRAWLGAAFAETRANADGVVFVSRATRDDFHRLFGAPAREAIIGSPIGVADAAPEASGRDARPYLLAVQHGEHHPHKNVEGLLRLYAGLAERIPDLDLAVAGRGEAGFLAARNSLPAELRVRVRHLGFVPRARLAALYRDAGAFVSLSRFEGFNMPAAEAACHGTPLILSDLPAHRELHGGIACLLDPAAPDVAAAARYLAEDAKRLRGYRWAAADSCSAAAVASAHLRFIDEVDTDVAAKPWQVSATTRVFRVGSGRRRPSPSRQEVARAAVRRQRLARLLLAGTVLGGATAIGGLLLDPTLAWAAPACSPGATNASGGNGGASSDGGAPGIGGCNATFGNTGIDGTDAPSGTPYLAYYGGGGGGAGADQNATAGGNGGLDGSATASGGGGGASNTAGTGQSGGTGFDAGSTTAGGGGGGGGFYGFLSTTSGSSVGTVSGGTGGNGGGNTYYGGNGGGGGGGGGGAGLIAAAPGTAGVTITPGTVRGGAGGQGGSAYYGLGGDGGAGGIGTIVSAAGGVVTLQPGATIIGGRGGDGGYSAGNTSGRGGAGGVGVQFIAGGLLVNQGTITGGDAGGVGTQTANLRILSAARRFATDAVTAGTPGVGGDGVVGGDLTVVTSGAISGGLASDGVTRANAITFTGGANTLTLQSGFTLNGNIAVAGTVTFAQTDSVEVTNIGDASQNGSGVAGTTAITGPGSLIKTGTGTLILSGSNSYAGTTTIEQGILQVGAVPGTLTSSSLSTGSVVLDGGTLQAAPRFDNGTTSNVNFTLSNDIQIGMSGGTVSTHGNDLTLSGNITDGATLPGRLSVITDSVNGRDTLTLSGKSNTFTGGLTVGDRTTVQIGAANAAGAGSLTLQGTGALNLASFDQSVTELNGSATSSVTNTGTFTANVLNTLTVQSGAFQGSITDGTSSANGSVGQVALTKVTDGSASGGTLVLTGTNTYTGGTSINAGTLQIGAGGTTGSIVGDVADNAALVFNRSGTVTYGGAVSGAGSLTQAGAGTLVLTGANTYAGTTFVNAGTLQIGAGGTTGSIVGDVTDNAALVFAHSDTLVYGGRVTGAGSLTQAGAGTLVLTGANTYAGGTFVNAGALQVGAGGTAGSITGDVTDNAALVFARSDTLTYGGRVTGAGSLTQAGAGTLVLTGANTYAGGTFINAGALQVGAGGTAGSIAGDVADNAALVFARSDTLTYGGRVTGAGSLTQAGTGTLVLTGANTYGGGTFVNAGTLQVGAGGTTGSIAGNVVDNGALVFDRSDALAYGGGVSGSGSLTQAGSGTLVLTGTNTYAGSTVINAGTLQVGAGGTTGSIAGNVVDNAALAFNRSDALAYGGTVSGSGSLTQAGTGTLVLTGANTYGGGTFVNAGTLQVGAGGTAGSIAGNIVDNAALVFNRSDTLVYVGAVSGAGSLTQAGAGSLVLTGTSSYTGATTVAAGRLAVNGALGNTAVTVARGATLGGAGTIAGSVTIADGGILAPGNSPGILTVGGLTLTPGRAGSTGSILNYELGTVASGAGPASDRTDVARDLVLAGTLNATDAGGFTYGSYRIFNYGGGLTNQGLAVGTLPAGFTGVIQTAIPQQVNLVVASPTTPVQFWDGALLTGNGTIAGGSGTWNNALTNWTDANGVNNAPWGRGVGVFAGAAGTVTVADAIAFQGLQFITDGYRLVAAAGGSLTPTGQAFVRLDAGTTATIAAPITGPGGLNKVGGGTLVLTGAASYTGGTTIGGGTLQIGDGGATGSIAGDIVDNGRLAFARSDTLTYGGTVSGSGSLTQAGSGTLVLTGADTYAGGTTISAGTLQIGAGGTAGSVAGDITDNAALVFNRSDTLTYGGTISGSGSLTQAGSGTLVLTGANTYTGQTTVAAGTTLALSGAGSIASSSAVAIDGTLDLSAANAPSLVSLNGAGRVALGARQLTLLNASGIFAGTLGGAGSLAIQAGTETLTGANSYTGGTTITPGATLRVGAGGTTGAIVGDVADGGTLAFDRADDVAFAGRISGDGSVVKAGAGALRLRAVNSYAGGTFLRQGTLDIANGRALGTGPLSMDDGTTLSFAAQGVTFGNDIVFTGVADPTIDTRANTATLSGDISGAGALTKQGSGMLILTGTDTATGATRVAAGTLEVDGTADASAVAVASGATLSGTGSVGSIAARAGSRIAPGSAANPYGVLRTPGSAAFAQGATFQVAIDAAGRNSALAVGGTATLGGAAVTVTSATGTYDASTRYTILTAAGGVQGAFGSLSTAEALAFLSPYLTYSADAVTLNFRSNGTSFVDVAVTPNERSVAGALQSLDPAGALVRSLQGLSPDAARRALDALAGAVHASVATTAAQDARRVSGQILDRLWNIGGGEIDARTLLQQLDRPRELPAFVNCFAPAPAADPRTPPTIVTAWGEGFGDFGHDGADRNGAGLDRRLGGFIVGYDAPLHGLGAPYRIGIAGGYTDDAFSGTGTGGRGSAGTFESIFGSVYGGARFGAVDVRAGAAVAGTSSTVNRAVAYPGFPESERSVYGGNTEQVFGELGYRFSGTRWVVEPVVNAAYIHVHQDGFRERGGAAALTGSAQDDDVGTTTLGARGEVAPFVGVPLVARAFLGWRHAFGDLNPSTRLAFQSGSIPFTSQGAALDRNALASEAGLDWRFSGALTLGLAYIGQVGERDYDNGVKGRAEYKF